jgi:hypothetical protein
MKFKWRVVLKWLLTGIMALFFVILLQVASLAFPQPFFSHKLGSLSLIAYSDEEFDDTLRDVIVGVEERLGAMEIRDPQPLQRVYICHNPKLYAFFTYLSLVPARTMGFNLSIFENTFISRTRIEEVRNGNVRNLRHTFLEGDIEQVISHELAHAYTQQKLGFRVYRTIPFWKTDGYAEYASTISAIRTDSRQPLLKRIGILLDDSFWGSSNIVRKIYQSQLLVEFLSEIKGLSFMEIMSDQVTEDRILEEMKWWAVTQ